MAGTCSSAGDEENAWKKHEVLPQPYDQSIGGPGPAGLPLGQCRSFLTEGEFLMSMSLATTFLQEYTWLNNWAQAEDRKLYHKVMKFHQFIHLVKNSRFINPRYHWCFKSEDFVGHCARLGHSVSMGVAATKLSTKVMPKYRILLHLLLSREGMA